MSEPTAPPPRILVVDDEPQIRKFLSIALRSQGLTVVEATTGGEALERMATDAADLVVLDLGLPDLDGLDVLRDLRSWSTVPVIVLSVRASESEKVRALDAGAHDYVTKPFGIQELMARIRGLLRRRESAGEGLPRFDDGHLIVDLARRRVALDGEPLALTRKEYGVLAELVRHSGRVVTQRQLLRTLWGAEHEEDTQYLRVVVGRIRQKLGDDHAAPRYLQTEHGVGYRFVGDERPEDPEA